jgi:23S rRNA (adenine1618-N6)-methyltransferase
MVEQSNLIRNRCFWFSTLVSKKTTLPSIYYSLEKAKALEVNTINMAQGQKISRIVAWTFLTKEQQKEWKQKRWTKTGTESRTQEQE